MASCTFVRNPSQVSAFTVPLERCQHYVVAGHDTEASASLLNCLHRILYLEQAALWTPGGDISVVLVSVHGFEIATCAAVSKQGEF